LAWSFIRNKITIVLMERQCHATEKPEAIACARRCRSSWLTRWWTQKWRAEEEKRHKGSLKKHIAQKIATLSPCIGLFRDT
jgi:hypothetical protein